MSYIISFFSFQLLGRLSYLKYIHAFLESKLKLELFSVIEVNISAGNVDVNE